MWKVIANSLASVIDWFSLPPTASFFVFLRRLALFSSSDLAKQGFYFLVDSSLVSFIGPGTLPFGCICLDPDLALVFGFWFVGLFFVELLPNAMTTPAPTPRPTPLGAYQYRTQFGDSAYGFRSRNDYDGAWQYSFKRPGWSWQEPLSGTTGPFCYGPDSTCYNVTEPCNDFGGTLLHDSVCSFPQDVKIMGPSCWEGNCLAKGQATCTALGGVHIGVDDGTSGPQWCAFRGATSFIGPMCYGDTCYPEDTQVDCGNLNGQVWNENYCAVSGYYFPAG